MRGRRVVPAGSTARPSAPSGSSFSVELPWPAPALWPNARKHWATKARAAKALRNAGFLLMHQEIGGRTFFFGGQLLVDLEFRPPARRRDGSRNPSVPDVDNCVAALKAGLDGIADALGVDDRVFRLQPPQLLAASDDDAAGSVRVTVKGH